jgi:voltage-gated potassium channel Kch
LKSITLRDRLNYWFDNVMSRGTIALIIWLIIATFTMLLVIALLAHLTTDGQGVSILELMWISLLRTLDPGTMGGDVGTPPYLLLMFMATVGGIFVVGALVGILTNGIDVKLTDLRKGRSLVVEKGHTVILGWSPQVFSILSELVIANENQRNACLAVLAPKDKVEMEDEVRAKIANSRSTRIVCRTGNPMDLDDLEIINPHRARSIIILSPDHEDPDSNVIKSILALTNNPKRPPTPYHIVAAIHDPENMEGAQLVGGNEAKIILANDLIARIIAQTCRQSGLSVVYTELLDFEGDEIYFNREPLLNGKTFGEALFMFEDSSLIGLRYANGGVKLNPPMDTIIQPDDQIIAISEDDDTIGVSMIQDYKIDRAAICEKHSNLPRPEHTLVLGWNQRGPTIIKELNSYVAPGSEVKVFANREASQMEADCDCKGIYNQQINFEQGDATNRRALDRLGINNYQHVIILSDVSMKDPQKADARTLVTLLHLRDLADQYGHPFSIVSEMLDIRNRELAEVTRADDFIVSDRLISLMLSQVSENNELYEVFGDLFDPEGSEIYLKHAGDYVELKRPINFYTVLESARRRGEIAIGYRLQAEANDQKKFYGVHVNPDKSNMITLTEQDRIILLAEEE